MSRKLLIKGGIVACPKQNLYENMDLVIQDGVITELKKDITDTDAEILDVKGKIVCPGLIDMHSHLREPGREDIGTIQSGSESAAAGGFTSIACMPNTTPAIDNQMGIEYIKSRSKAVGLVNIYPIASVTKGLNGQELVEISRVVEAGAVALSDDDSPITDTALMRQALEYCTMFDIPIISHCEDPFLSEDGCVNEGLVSTKMGFKGIPSIAEDIIVSRDITLASYTQSKIHIAHVSTPRSIEIIRQAKAGGVRVSCEVSPNHFSLTENDVLNSHYNTNTKMYPPLRDEASVRAIISGLQDGTIDSIATDHSPWLDTEKDIEYIHAPMGVIGFETAIPLIWTKLVATGELSPLTALAKITCEPAKILNIPGGDLLKGSPGDVTIIDPDLELTIDHDFFHSISHNSPFIGHTLQGFAIYTIVGGQIIFNRHTNTITRRDI